VTCDEERRSLPVDVRKVDQTVTRSPARDLARRDIDRVGDPSRDLPAFSTGVAAGNVRTCFEKHGVLSADLVAHQRAP
jgi:hypothetical protein